MYLYLYFDFSYLIFLLLNIEVQGQTYSILVGTVTSVDSKWLAIKSDDGEIVKLRVGSRTIYPTRKPDEGDKVKVEYLINRGVYIGFSVAILESAKREIGPQKKGIESRPQLPPNLPPEIASFAGTWEGSWDNRKEMHFTLTFPNINLEIAEVKYQSRDLNFSEKARVISGQKPKIEWMIYGKAYTPAPIWFTFEIQGEGTLKGTLDDRSIRDPVMRKAVLRRVD